MQSPAPKNADFDAIRAAREVLAVQRQGIEALSNSLDDKFVSAVEAIAQLKGRLIISGMGKSGHIGRKIAATLASTGTPAFFVHPAEASHGDLGMIAPEDGLLLLSNSGETAELGDMIHYAKRFGILLIGMVRRPTSMLVKAADIPLVLPEIPEASPTGAPTTSTTMMLALGDALAMALLERRGFTPEDFQTFHPGGKLGKRFIRVEELMHAGEEMPVVAEGTGMDEALIEMTRRGFGCVGVIKDVGVLAGIVTDGDLRRHMSKDLIGMRVEDVMTANPLTTRPDALAVEALGMMNARKVTALFALGPDGKPEGLLHLHDCLRAGIA